MHNRVRRVIEDGGLALGGLTGNFTGPGIVEIIALAGADAILVDLEHHAYDLSDVQVLVVTAERMNVTPIVRIPALDPAFILRLLNMGVQCIQLDGINSAEEARALVNACRFPPEGSRGLIWNSRSARYGSVSRKEYATVANRETLVKISIDSAEGLDAVEEIAQVPGVDIIGVGAHDLSSVLGVVGQPDHPSLVEAIERVVRAVNADGRRRLALPIGNAAYPRSSAELVAMGAVYANLSPHPEERLLRSMSTHAAEIRAAAGTPPAA